MRKAKIVDTIGPATSSLEVLTDLVKTGMNVARINRSHGTVEEHLAIYDNIRKAGELAGKNVVVNGQVLFDRAMRAVDTSHVHTGLDQIGQDFQG